MLLPQLYLICANSCNFFHSFAASKTCQPNLASNYYLLFKPLARSILIKYPETNQSSFNSLSTSFPPSCSLSDLAALKCSLFRLPVAQMDLGLWVISAVMEEDLLEVFWAPAVGTWAVAAESSIVQLHSLSTSPHHDRSNQFLHGESGLFVTDHLDPY
jgi:hypothetical protein